MRPRIEIAILFSSFLLLLAIPICSEGYTTTQTYMAVTEPRVEVRDLTLNSYSVYPGSSIDFSVSLRNFGTASTTATSEVKIYDASDTVVGTISYDAVVLYPGQMATIQKTWSTGSLPIGTYRAVAQASYESNLSNTVEKNFSIINPTTPPGQPTKEVLPIIIPPTITPVKGKVVFLKTTVLKELLAGEGGVESISLKNVGESILNITLSLGGIPQEWAVLPSDKTLILPNETRIMNLGLSLPQDVPAGDYLVKLDANGGANSTDFLALRVKSYPEDYDEPIALKTIRIDENERKTIVSIDLKNPSKDVMDVVQLQERIPSSLNNEQIEFLDKQGKILTVNGAKMIVWEFTNIHPQETFHISYNINNFLTDYSTYMSWHISQILVTSKQSTADLVRVLELTSSSIGKNGTGEVSASVLYVGNEPEEVTILLEVPQGFNAEPTTITRILIPKAVTSVNFKLTASKIEHDTYMVRLFVLGKDFSTYMATPVLVSREITPSSFSLLSVLSLEQVVAISSFMAAAVVVTTLSYRRIRIGSKAEYSPERLDYMRNIKKMVVAKRNK
ncbi:hypothetical protein H0N99_00445 [Candidatus Micrarchaeota archaeon]|nr:hypothetical protein [Candidatus Micrarchaeota archaeon]